MYPFVFAAGRDGLLLRGGGSQRPRPAEFLAVVLWAAYAVYEYYVANGTLCDANCNIRVDLVLFFPLLGWARLSRAAEGAAHGRRRGAQS